MKATQISFGQCFSREGMEGSYYRESKDNGDKYEYVHEYDKDGYYINNSSKRIDKIYGHNRNIFYISDSKGNPIDKFNLEDSITPMDVYNNLFKSHKQMFLSFGKTEDKANRKANIIAIKNTWKIYNEIIKKVQ